MKNAVPAKIRSYLGDAGGRDITLKTFNQLLSEHLDRYIQHLGRREQIAHLKASVRGLLSDLDRKSTESIARTFEGPSEVRNLSNFMTRSVFDEQGMLEEYQKELGGLLSRPGGIITGSGFDFSKRGKHSAGAFKQYSTALRRVSCCQAGIVMGYASPEGCGPLDFALFMPERWFGADYAVLRKKCRGPEDLKFSSRSELLAGMVNNARNSAHFSFRCAAFDSSFGADGAFLDSLPKEIIYFAEVPENHLVFARRPKSCSPPGSFSPDGSELVTEDPVLRTVKDIAGDPSVPWAEMRGGNGGSESPAGEDKCFRVNEERGGRPGKGVWLYVRRGRGGNLSFALSSETADADLEALRRPALMRLQAEENLKVCRELLGMDHCEARSWPAWRRHMLFSFIAHLFLAKLRGGLKSESETEAALSPSEHGGGPSGLFSAETAKDGSLLLSDCLSEALN